MMNYISLTGEREGAEEEKSKLQGGGKERDGKRNNKMVLSPGSVSGLNGHRERCHQPPKLSQKLPAHQGPAWLPPQKQLKPSLF